MPTKSTEPTLLMGSTGRVGKLLRAHWLRAGTPVLYQSRSDGFDLQWDPMVDGPDPLVDFAQTHGGLRAIVAMIGSTPSTAGDMADTPTLAASVVKAAGLAQVPRVLLASSAAVYPLQADMTENVSPAPTSPYGEAKLAMEHAVANTGVNLCCLRIGNVAGADALLGGAASRPPNEPVKLDQFPDGKSPARSYISPTGLAKCIDKLIAHAAPLPPVLNCASQPAVEMVDLLNAASLNWEWVPAPDHKLQTQRITLDCARLAGIIGEDALAASPSQMIAELKDLGVLR